MQVKEQMAETEFEFYPEEVMVGSEFQSYLCTWTSLKVASHLDVM